MPDESVCIVASVDSRYSDWEPSTTLRIFNAANFDSLTSIDLNGRPIESFVTIQNQEGDHLQPYLMCIGELGRTRLLSTSTLSLTAQRYVAPFSGIDVQGADYDIDGRIEIIGRGGFGLICVRLRQLSVAPALSLVPSPLSLSAFPNPFNSLTTISFSLPASGWTIMDVTDVNGRLVQRLSDGWKEAGSYREVFYCGGLATGQYLLILQGTSQAISTPLTIIK